MTDAPAVLISPFGAERRQREYRYADGHVLGGLAEFAYELAVRPRLDRVHGGRERHARDDHQQVAQRQAEYVRVGHVPHAPVPDEHQHQGAVAQHADHEDHGEHHGHDIGLRPARVRDVLAVVRRCRRFVHGVGRRCRRRGCRSRVEVFVVVVATLSSLETAVFLKKE